MAKFKKTAALSVAAVMAGSLVAFTACDDGEEESDKEVAVFLNTLLAQKVETLGMETEAVVTTKAGAGTSVLNVTESMKLNLKTGDADIVLQEKEGDTLKEGQNIFLRDWNIFTYDQVKNGAAESWNGVTLAYEGNVFAEAAGESGMSWTDYASVLGSTELAAGDYALAKFADSFDGLTVTEDTAVIDLNKTLSNTVKEINSVLGSLNEKTTVGDFLNMKSVKKIFMPFTELITPAEIRALVAALIDSLTASSPEMQQALLLLGIDADKLFPAPKADTSTYDYLLKVISSEDMKNAVNTIVTLIGISQGQTSFAPALSTTINKMKLSELFALAGVQMSDVTAAFGELTENVTEECFAVATPDTAVALEDMKIVYTLAEGAITGQEFTANCEVITADGTVTVCVNARTEYPAVSYLLADISACNTEEFITRYTDGAEIDCGYLNNLGYTLSQKVTDNKVVRLVLTDSKGTQRSIAENVPFTVYDNDTPVSLSVEFYSDYIEITGDGYWGSYPLIGVDGVLQNTVSGILQGTAGTFIPVE